MLTHSAVIRPASTALRQALPLTAMGLLALAAWLVQHPFVGIKHDSVLYTLFALARLHPDTLTADVFLRFGSQDQFSLFTPIYAASVNLFGMEHAAALLLLVSQAILYTCAWLLARRFMAPLEATLSIALLVALPDDYGPSLIFHAFEPFITARLPAEALVVGAVLAAVTQRYWIAAGCIVVAMLLHPIMGAAGAAFLILTYVVPRHPKLSAVAAGVGFIATLGIVIAVAPLGRLQDKDWLSAINWTSDYLFVTTWHLPDWSRAAVYPVLLMLGCQVGVAPALRRICAGLLATVASGMLITLVFGDLLHVTLFIDLQAWRWLWLANVLALVLAPAILQDSWRRGYSGRIAVVVLASLWVFRTSPAAFLGIPAIIALAAMPSEWNQHKYWKWLFLGACALLGLGICLSLVNRFSYVPVPDARGSRPLQQVRFVCNDGLILGALLFGTWIMLRGSGSNGAAKSWRALAAILAATAACAWLVPFGWQSYSAVNFTPELASRFAPWRAEIPPHAEVLWPDNPTGGWYLLERPIYWSVAQLAGAIFSRDKALLAQRRNTLINTALKNSNLLVHIGSQEDLEKQLKTGAPANASHMDLKAMRAVCADPDLRYIVSWMSLAPTPFPPVNVDPSKAHGKLYLYRCADLRS